MAPHQARHVVVLAFALAACSGRHVDVAEEESAPSVSAGGVVGSGATASGGSEMAACGGSDAFEPAGGSAGTWTGGSAGQGAGGARAGGGGKSSGGAAGKGGGGGGGGKVGAGGVAGSSAGGDGAGGTGGGYDPGPGTCSPDTVVPNECRGIKTGMACQNEGLLCSNLPCGLADTGCRQCLCSTTWSCTPCDYSSSPLKDQPIDPWTCTEAVADKVACVVEWDVCVGAPSSEVCACYTDSEGALIWDCDKPPSSWL
jgi:hypothetical protein